MILLDLFTTIRGITSLQVSLAFLYVLLGIIVSRFGYRLVFFLEKELEVNSITRRFGVPVSVGEKEARFVRSCIVGIFVVVALAELNLAVLAVRSIIWTVAIYIVVFTLIALKDYVFNFVHSFGARKKFKVGKKLSIAGLKGKVRSVSRAAVTLRTDQGDILYVPYSYTSSALPTKKRR